MTYEQIMELVRAESDRAKKQELYSYHMEHSVGFRVMMEMRSVSYNVYVIKSGGVQRQYRGTGLTLDEAQALMAEIREELEAQGRYLH